MKVKLTILILKRYGVQPTSAIKEGFGEQNLTARLDTNEKAVIVTNPNEISKIKEVLRSNFYEVFYETEIEIDLPSQ
jgi:hypothetical protein